MISFIYKFLKYFNDVKAVKNGRIAKRIGWRVGGKISGGFLNRLFK